MDEQQIAKSSSVTCYSQNQYIRCDFAMMTAPQTLSLVLLGEIAPAVQTIPPIPTHSDISP